MSTSKHGNKFHFSRQEESHPRSDAKANTLSKSDEELETSHPNQTTSNVTTLPPAHTKFNVPNFSQMLVDQISFHDTSKAVDDEHTTDRRCHFLWSNMKTIAGSVIILGIIVAAPVIFAYTFLDETPGNPHLSIILTSNLINQM